MRPPRPETDVLLAASGRPVGALFYAYVCMCVYACVCINTVGASLSLSLESCTVGSSGSSFLGTRGFSRLGAARGGQHYQPLQAFAFEQKKAGSFAEQNSKAFSSPLPTEFGTSPTDASGVGGVRPAQHAKSKPLKTSQTIINS